jgi:transposase
VHGADDTLQVDNDAQGWKEACAWFRARGVTRVGVEATGGYERGVVEAMWAEGLEVVIHQPLEVKLFARLKRWRAKNDPRDARLVAAATAQVDAVKAAQDPVLQSLAEWLTAYEQITDQLAELKGFMEHVRLSEVQTQLNEQITSLKALKARLAQQVIARIKANAELLRRFELLQSLPSVGSIVAAGLLIRMPELGTMKHGQPAALLGVAPYDHDSGTMKGQRHIAGGRRRPRRLLYLSAMRAKSTDPYMKAVAQRLIAKGKKPKQVTVAVMRHLIEAANLVLSRGQPWIKEKTA